MMLIRLLTLVEAFGRTGGRAERCQVIPGPAAAFPQDAFTQGGIVAPEILIADIGRHVGDLMGRQCREWL